MPIQISTCDGWGERRRHRTVCTQVGSTSWRLPVLVRTAVTAPEVVGWIMTEAVVETLPAVRTAGRALC